MLRNVSPHFHIDVLFVWHIRIYHHVVLQMEFELRVRGKVSIRSA